MLYDLDYTMLSFKFKCFNAKHHDSQYFDLDANPCI